MTTTNKPIIWTIAGADCSGGAGIAADIKTGHVLNVEVCHLITANTVQNSQSLVSVNPVNVDILTQQANALIGDKSPSVIKIGLVVSIEQIYWLTRTIAQVKAKNPQLKVVLDPVGQASVGGNMSKLSHEDYQLLLPYIDVITPNLPEAKKLAQSTSNNSAELAQKIQNYGINSVVITGGHALENTESVSDYCLHKASSNDGLIDDNVCYQLQSPRINTDYSHGGGCSFASAISAYLAHGYLLRDALTLSKTFINQGLAANNNKLDYYGAFEQQALAKTGNSFPRVTSAISQKYQELAPFKSLGIKRGGEKKLGLYPVVDSIYWLKTLLPLNLEIIQLRLKGYSTDQASALIQEAVRLFKNSKTRLFINDYWQLAIEHGAYGVHIGQEDLLDADLNAIQTAGLRLGISTHGCYEFLLAQQLSPSYLAIGAIFPTRTKDMTGQIQGLDNLDKILALSTDIPVVAIGGITLDKVDSVWGLSSNISGPDSIAVVTAITEADDPIKAAKAFMEKLA